MSAGRICSRVIATASPDETIRVAARRMADFDVGSLVVLDVGGKHQAVGIVTDRDIAVRCVAAKRDPDHTRIGDVMTTPVQMVNERIPLEEAVTRMGNSATRRLVVTGDGDRVVGLLSLDDVLDVLVQEVGAMGRLLTRQRPHVPA